MTPKQCRQILGVLSANEAVCGPFAVPAYTYACRRSKRARRLLVRWYTQRYSELP